MVTATELLICVITRTPRKLNIALVMMAERASMQRVVIHVAMALGASVHPLTKMTPSVRRTVIVKIALEPISFTKYKNDTSMRHARFHIYFFRIIAAFIQLRAAARKTCCGTVTITSNIRSVNVKNTLRKRAAARFLL